MKAREFTTYLKERLAAHDIYIWGGQGEEVKNLTVSQIVNAETSRKNAARVFEHIAANLRLQYDVNKMRAYDCSGLGVRFFIEHGLVKRDMTAQGLYGLCEPISLLKLQEGDMVFIANSKSVKTHVGYYIGDGLVIEAAGRDYGVIQRTVRDGSTNGAWTHAGRPPFWDEGTYLCRILKYIKGQIMTGDDVEAIQTFLATEGYTVGTIDGEYGPQTTTAVKAFQYDNNLTVDGIIGKITACRMGFEWGGA